MIDVARSLLQSSFHDHKETEKYSHRIKFVSTQHSSQTIEN